VSFGEQPIHHLAAHHSESNESEIGHSLPSPQEADFERAASSPAGALRESSRTCRKWAFIASRAPLGSRPGSLRRLAWPRARRFPALGSREPPPDSPILPIGQS